MSYLTQALNPWIQGGSYCYTEGFPQFSGHAQSVIFRPPILAYRLEGRSQNSITAGSLL